MPNFYLEFARKILEIAREPLTAREIINRATKADLIPQPYRRAKTPHKTVHARLANPSERTLNGLRFVVSLLAHSGFALIFFILATANFSERNIGRLFEKRNFRRKHSVCSALLFTD